MPRKRQTERHPNQQSPLRAVALVAASLLATAVATAQPATLVKDIYPGSGPQTGSSSHSELVRSGSLAYFTSDAGGSGAELWRTDGTPAGTRLVADILPLAGTNAAPSDLTDVNGTLFFTTGDFSPVGLWKTDGTAAGTILVLRLNPGEFLANLANVAGTLFFFKSGSGGSELWKSDGTPSGTVLVRAGLTPGSSPSASMTDFHGTLFFAANDGVSGVELWKSDGTPAGTVLVHDINPGSAPSFPYGFTALGAQLFFSAFEPTHGSELWKTDGSDAGTVLVQDIEPGPNSSNPSSFVPLGGELIFTANASASGAELWRTDGSAAGTVLVRDIRPGSASSFPDSLTAGPGGVYFNADDGFSGREVWITDGTAGGTIQLADLFSGPGSSFSGPFVVLGPDVFFSARDSAHLFELWKSDGTPGGTVAVKDVAVSSGIVNLQGSLLFFGTNSDPFSSFLWKSDGSTAGTIEYFRFDVPAGSSPGSMVAAGTGVVFTANSVLDGIQLWRSDGSGPGTQQLTSFEPTSTGSFGGSPPVTSGGRTFFARNGFLWVTPGSSSAVEPLNSQPAFIGNLGDFGGTLLFQFNGALWKSDGTSAGTQLVHALPDGASMFPPFKVGSIAYFVLANLPGANELWKTDGTPGGTGLVKQIDALEPFSRMAALNGFLYFPVGFFPGGAIWRSDGTDSGTQPIIPLTGTELTVIGSTLFFSAPHLMTGVELWKTDGTLNGTHLVKDIQPGTQSSTPQQLVAVGGELYFVADDGIHGPELWKSDGSEAGTSMVLDIRPGADSPNIQSLTASGSLVYFTASDFSTGTELWKSDGTPGGTSVVKDINPGAASSSPDSLTDAGGVLFFAAFDPRTGRELWKSDGTISGTVLVRDIEPGLNSSAPHAGSEVAGLLYFAANSASGGIELWKSDGSPAGTLPVKDLIPGPFSSYPGGIVPLGTHFLFVGTDEAHGHELWTSDGTEAGTTLLKDINPGINSSTPAPLTPFAGRFYFGADDGVHGRELWVTDGTAGGTVLLTDLSPGAASGNPQSFLVNGAFLFFTGPPPSGSSAPAGLWRTDGTSAGTILLSAIQYAAPVSLAGLVYFEVFNGTSAELWKTDGTMAGTQLAAPFPAGGSSLIPSGPFLYYWVLNIGSGVSWELQRTDGTAAGALVLHGGFGGNAPPLSLDVGGIFFFSADDGTHGGELWKSDGTVAGTVLVKDIWPGPLGSGVAGMLDVGGTLLFRANDGVHGSELWMSNGTSAGTVLLQDINPGFASSRPFATFAGDWGAVAGTRVFFAASDSVTGDELWSMPMSAICSPPAVPVIQSSRNPSCGDSVVLDAGPGYASYLWSTGETTRTIRVSPAVTTAYTVYTGNAKGCRSSATIVQAIDPALVPPPPSASNSGPACVGTALQLTASTVVGGTYAWTGPNGFTSTQQNPTIPAVTLAAAGLYSVTVTVNGCPSAAVTTAVTVTPVPFVPVAHSSGVLCTGETIQLTASTVPGGTYAWTGPNGFTSTLQNPAIPSAIAADSGVFSVTVTVNGCTSPAATTSVSVTACQVRPVALSSDAAGDGILEPGETAVVAPSWLNATGSAVALTGNATAFTGPAGATYSLVDSIASYGTVAPGATASCVSTGDCYAVGVSNPALRPLLHWDAVFSEALSTGDGKAWRLHIGESFTDVASNSPFYRFVETLLHNGVTTGCGGGGYCPGSSVTRAQMAVFLLVSQAGTAFTPPAAIGVFTDVPVSSSFAPWIEELAHRGVTAGCGSGLFCPDAGVTRAQMAVFLLVTHDGAAYVPPPAVGLFNDVPSASPFAPWIEELFHRGVAAGCGNGNYCPASAVSRAQMAVFLTTTFSLSIGAP